MPLLGIFVLAAGLLFWLSRSAVLNARAVDRQQKVLKRSNQALLASEERFKSIAEAASDWIWEVDGHFVFTYLSVRFRDVTGYQPEAWIGRRLDELLDSDTVNIVKWLEGLPDAGAPSSLVCAFRDSQGQARVGKLSASAIRNGVASGYRGTAADITDEVEAHAKIQHLSLHDALTGLPNRNKLFQFLERLLAEKAGKSPVAVLMLDLDRFKPINDQHGHPAGDAVLYAIAERLRASTRDQDMVARLGGDEFVVVSTHVSSKLEIEKFCSRLIDVINREVAYEGHSFHVGASIGVALAPEHGGDPRGLLRCADVAMYEAKAAGRNTWRFYLEAMDSHLAEKKLRETELRAALQNGEFELYYQPRFLAQEQTIASAEALIRWNHPRRGLIGPDEFIGLAEESDLIVQIGNWVLREACATAASWPGEVMVSVNVSPAQFMTGDIVWQVREALRLARLDARRLELEVTENVMLNDVDGALRTMTALRSWASASTWTTSVPAIPRSATCAPIPSTASRSTSASSPAWEDRARPFDRAGHHQSRQRPEPAGHRRGRGDRRADAYPARRAMPRTARVPAQPAAGCAAPARSAGARGGADPGATGFRRRPCCAPALSGRQKGARGASAALGSAIALRMVQKMLN